jgi:hypothetical protein
MLVAMRLGPPLNGRWRGATRATGVAVAGVFGDFDTGFALWRFAGRLGPPADAPDACVAPFGGSGGPGFTCGRFAGRLGAIFGAPRFTPGFPAEGFGGTSVAVLTTGLASALDTGLAAGFATGFVAGLAAGFAAGFGAGLAGADALKRREKIPFFSATVGHHLDEIGNSTRVAPLVVIPGDHLCKRPVHHHGALSVDDCRPRVTSEIGRDEWFV